MRTIFVALAIVAGLGATSALAADRARAIVTCKPAPEKLAYDCTFKLSNARTGAPLDQWPRLPILLAGFGAGLAATMGKPGARPCAPSCCSLHC